MQMIFNLNIRKMLASLIIKVMQLKAIKLFSTIRQISESLIVYIGLMKIYIEGDTLKHH